jgi:hypothetical protein
MSEGGYNVEYACEPVYPREGKEEYSVRVPVGPKQISKRNQVSPTVANFKYFT